MWFIWSIFQGWAFVPQNFTVKALSESSFLQVALGWMKTNLTDKLYWCKIKPATKQFQNNAVSLWACSNPMDLHTLHTSYIRLATYFACARRSSKQHSPSGHLLGIDHLQHNTHSLKHKRSTCCSSVLTAREKSWKYLQFKHNNETALFYPATWPLILNYRQVPGW